MNPLKVIAWIGLVFCLISFLVWLGKSVGQPDKTMVTIEQPLNLINIRKNVDPELGWVARFKDADTGVICYEYQRSISCVVR